MTKILNKNIIWAVILSLICASFIPIEASAASSKTLTKNGIKMQYKVKIVKNQNFNSDYAKNLTVKSSKTKASLKWNKVSGASGYFVLKKSPKSKVFKQIAKTKKTSFTDKRLKKNKTYSYVVYPYKIKGGKYYIANGCSKVITRTTNSSKKPDTVKGASINKSTLSLNVGKTANLSVKYNGNPFSKWTRWYSSNTKVATVNSSGKVTAKATGATTITAKRPSGYNLTCRVTVKKESSTPVAPGESINPPSEESNSHLKIDKQNITLFVGETNFITATVDGIKAKPEDPVFWSSSSQNIATIENGLITALSKGTVTITIYYGDETAKCQVTVKERPIYAESISISGTYRGDTFESGMTAKSGREVKLTASILPESTTNKTISWSSNDPSIAAVSNNGTVTTKEEGTAVITATAEGGAKKDFNINVSSHYPKNETLGIEIRDTFNKAEMDNRFGTPVLSFTYGDNLNSYGDTTVYVYDRNNTYENYVEVYVCDGKITGWFTNADEKVTFENGIKIDSSSNIAEKLNCSSHSTEYYNQPYSCEGNHYTLRIFEERTDNKGIVACGVWDTDMMVKSAAKNEEMVSKHMLYITNAIRHEYNLPSFSWLEEIRPALEVVVDSWNEWNSLYNPETGKPHQDKYGREHHARLEQETNICNERGLKNCGENGVTYVKTQLSEFTAIGTYWNSSGHKHVLLGTCSQKCQHYAYILTKDRFSGMIFVCTEI